MVQDSVLALAHMSQQTAADSAYGAALELVECLAILSSKARAFDPTAPRYAPGTLGQILGHDEVELEDGRPRLPGDWAEWGATFGRGFVAYARLMSLLTPELRMLARRANPRDYPVVKLGKARPEPSVIEAVAGPLGTSFRNILYFGRSHPLEPDKAKVLKEAQAAAIARQVELGKPPEPFGAGALFEKLMEKEWRALRERLRAEPFGDLMVMVREWQAQDARTSEATLTLLKYRSIDFDDLEVQLEREAAAAVAIERAELNATMLHHPAVADVVNTAKWKTPDTLDEELSEIHTLVVRCKSAATKVQNNKSEAPSEKALAAINAVVKAMPSIDPELRAVISGKRAIEIEAATKGPLQRLREAVRIGFFDKVNENDLSMILHAHEELLDGVFLPQAAVDRPPAKAPAIPEPHALPDIPQKSAAEARAQPQPDGLPDDLMSQVDAGILAGEVSKSAPVDPTTIARWIAKGRVVGGEVVKLTAYAGGMISKAELLQKLPLLHRRKRRPRKK